MVFDMRRRVFLATIWMGGYLRIQHGSGETRLSNKIGSFGCSI